MHINNLSDRINFITKSDRRLFYWFLMHANHMLFIFSAVLHWKLPLFHAYGSGSRTADNCMEDLQAITDANNKNQLIEKNFNGKNGISKDILAFWDVSNRCYPFLIPFIFIAVNDFFKRIVNIMVFLISTTLCDELFNHLI